MKAGDFEKLEVITVELMLGDKRNSDGTLAKERSTAKPRAEKHFKSTTSTRNTAKPPTSSAIMALGKN